MNTSSPSGNTSALVNRVHDIIRRMSENINQSEATKTCYGILAIMSREESSKIIIVKNGLEIILNGMHIHLDKGDVQEAGCDLIWSLAFNNTLVKEMIGNINGTSILVRGLKRHYKSPEYLKSACGALSNLCQFKLNQQNFASQGGLHPLLHSIPFHQTNLKLLPFIFDALASLIVGNEENARIVTSQEGIVKILTILAQHKESTSSPEIVKSGCHTLAILSDIKGHASKIALAGGVMIILPLLDIHSAYSDLHRVAAVVLLRMLQESSQVIRDIISNEGVRILLKSLDKGGAQQDTVAALTHILATVTNPLTTASLTSIESQLWISSPNNGPPSAGRGTLTNLPAETLGEKRSSSRFNRPDPRHPNAVQGSDSLCLGNPRKLSNSNAQTNHGETTTALGGLVRLMGQYSDRKDVSRASCRLLSHLIGTYPGVGMALDKLFILDRIMECVDHHSQTKDILESSCSILKSLHKRSPLLSFNGQKLSSIRGLLFLLRVKCGTDEEIVTAATELLTKLIGAEIQRPPQMSSGQSKNVKGSATANQASFPSVSDWGQESLAICSLVVENLAIGMRNGASVDRLQTPSPPQDRPGSNPSIMPPVAATSNRVGTAPVTGAGVPLPGMVWSKTTPKLLTTLLDHLELLVPLLFRTKDPSTVPEMMIPSLQAVLSSLPARYTQEFSARINHLLSTLQQIVLGSHESQTPTPTPSFQPIRPGDRTNTDTKLVSKSGIIEETSNLKEWTDNVENLPNEKGRHFPLESNSSKKSLSFSEMSQQVDRLIQTFPTYLEPLAEDSGQPSYGMTYTGRMQLCYENSSLPGGKSIQSRCPVPVPYSVPPGGMGLPFHHTIRFSSEFESANLYRAIQRDEREYDLCLRSDLHTPGHTQWFYFSVSNLLPEITEDSYFPPSVTSVPLKIKFNIINLTKPDSLFNQGMKPVIYGVNASRTKNLGWLRSGSNISYFSNSYPRGNTSGEGNEYYYTLTFTLEFPDISDTYYIAYYYPYTYSDHKAHLQELLSTPSNKDKLRSVKLCSTLGGFDCDLLIVTNFRENKDTIGPVYTPPQTTINSTTSTSSPVPFSTSTSGSGKLKSNRVATASYSSQHRKGIVISARVHPGEPPASYMMKGFIDFIVSSHPVATLLRSQYIFYLVPMLNPDGVIFGNNRCNLSGVDLNRQWKTPLKSLHPTIYALKSLLQDQKNYRDMYMYLDLHGHSRKYNIFLYGVDDASQGNGPNPNYATGSTLSFSSLPLLMTSTKKSSKSYSRIRSFAKFFSLHSIGSHYVSYSDCSFHIRKGRESTARVIVAKEIGIPLSFTIEATFCGTNYGMLQHYHMNIGHYVEVGLSLCDVILQYGIAEGDIPDIIWTNFFKASGKDTALKSSMIRDREDGSSRRSSRSHTSRSTSSGNMDGTALSHQLSSNSVSRRGSRQSEIIEEIDKDDGQETNNESEPVEIEENEDLAKEGEDDSDADGEDDDEPKCDVKEEGGGNQISDAVEDEENDDARSLTPPIDESGPRNDSSQPSEVASSRRCIQTAGSDTYRSFTCSSGRSDTAPSSSVSQQPLSYPGFSLSHHAITSPDFVSTSPSPSSVKRIAKDDGFSFSESVLANRMIAGLNTQANATNPLLSSTNPSGKSGGSVPLISSVNEVTRYVTLPLSISHL